MFSPPSLYYLVDAAVGVLCVAAEVRYVLGLFILIADNQRAIADGGASGAAVVAVFVDARQHGVGHIPGELTGDAAPGAQADTLVLDLIVGLVVDVAEAESTGIEFILVCRGGGADDRAVELGVFADGDVEAAFAGEDTGLLNHAVVVAVHLVAAEVDAVSGPGVVLLSRQLPGVTERVIS